jgi:hypothetical protein
VGVRSFLVLSEAFLLSFSGFCMWGIWHGIKTGTYANKGQPVFMHHDPAIFWALTGLLGIVAIGSLFVAAMLLRMAR